MCNEMQESEVWKRVMAMEKPEPIPRPYPTEPALPLQPEPRPEPEPPQPYAVMLEQAMEALRTYRREAEVTRGRCKQIWQQLAYQQNQQCHRILMAMQQCRWN